MEVIILAGGFGSRLKSVVSNVPKPMAPIGGRPFLEIILDRIIESGATRIVMSLGYLADLVVSHFGNQYRGVDIIYEIESTPRGTGGAIKTAIKHCKTDHAIVLNGDTYLEVELRDLEAYWERECSPIIVVREVSDVGRYGGVEISGDRIVSFLEKGGSGPGVINAGCYLIPKDLFTEDNIDCPFSIERDIFEKVIKYKRILAFLANGVFIDIGIPSDYSNAVKELSRWCCRSHV
jgi:D-glycero-alpha-D-manno-heptose 1-phosphate guanylyltransferase